MLEKVSGKEYQKSPNFGQEKKRVGMISRSQRTPITNNIHSRK